MSTPRLLWFRGRLCIAHPNRPGTRGRLMPFVSRRVSVSSLSPVSVLFSDSILLHGLGWPQIHHAFLPQPSQCWDLRCSLPLCPTPLTCGGLSWTLMLLSRLWLPGLPAVYSALLPPFTFHDGWLYCALAPDWLFPLCCLLKLPALCGPGLCLSLPAHLSHSITAGCQDEDRRQSMDEGGDWVSLWEVCLRFRGSKESRLLLLCVSPCSR